MENYPPAPPEPEWVHRMRARGIEVRRGTGPYYLPEEPEVRFTLPHEGRSSLRARITALARKLWSSPDASTRATRNAAVP